MNFLTLEDIDGAIYENQSFYIHKFDLRLFFIYLIIFD